MGAQDHDFLREIAARNFTRYVRGLHGRQIA